jgi:hypothetical protein
MRDQGTRPESAAALVAKLHEDRDVVEPFVDRLVQRLREKHPELNITAEDVSLSIEVRPRGAVIDPLSQAALRLRRMLSDMDKEGVVL